MRNFTTVLISMFILALAQMACGVSSAELPETIYTPIPATQTHSETLSAMTETELPPTPQITILGNVYLRDTAGVVRGSLQAGDVVSAVCIGDLCFMNGLTVWRGCTSERGEDAKCRKK
jgi:hypothetical protein